VPQQLEDYKDRIVGTGVTGVVVELKSRPIKIGKRYCFQRVTFEDKTSAFTSLRVYVEGHGYEHNLAESKNCLAATLYWLKDPIYLIPGERLVGKFTGTTTGDVLEMCITGYWELLK